METATTQMQKRDWDLEAAHRGSKSAVKRLVMRQRAYIEAIKPYADMKAEIYSRTLPTIIVTPDGQVTHRYDFTDQQKEQLRLCDELIDAVKAQFTGA